MDIYWVGAAAFLGAVLVGLVGWLKTPEPFAPRKFAASVITAILAGAVTAVAYQGSVAGPRDVVMAFLAGAGIDYARNVTSGAIAARVHNNTPPTP